jgi:ABC-type branched-subunit amino acid transport system permease subunit
VSGRVRGGAVAAGVSVAALWPFVITSTTAQRAGVQALVLALLGLSLTVTVGWLRLPTLFHTGAMALGAWATMRVLLAGQSVLLALVVAAGVGAVTGLAALAPVWRRPRPGLVVTSLVLSTVIWAVVVPRVGARGFTRPVIVGIDLGSDRALYLAALVVVLAAAAALGNLHRSETGRRLITLGAAPDLALRCGVRPDVTWAVGVALSGMVAGLAGLVAAVAQQSMPAAAAVSPAAAVTALAVPLVGGSLWATGSLVGAATAAVAARLVGSPEPAIAVQGALLVLAVLVLPGGLVPLARRAAARAAVSVRSQAVSLSGRSRPHARVRDGLR